MTKTPNTTHQPNYLDQIIGNNQQPAASHAVNTAPISADLRATNGTAAQPDQDGFVQWLSGTYPNAYNADEARHLWRHEHISALAWEAAKARYAAQPSRECLQQSAAGIDAIMEQAQVFASAWASVDGPFDNGDMIDVANEAKAELRGIVAAALQAAPPAPEAVAVLYVSPEQLAKHTDPEGPESAEAGRYLPTRKTPAGKFTQPLYAQAAAPAQAVAVPEGVNVDAWRKGARFALEAVYKVDSICWLTDSMREVCIKQAADAVIAERDRLFSGAPAQEHATQLAGQGQDFEPTAYFGLAAEQIDKLRTSGLKPEEIAGDDPAAQLDRVRELVWWFARFADGHANPKWLRGHAFELAYYIACMDVKRGIDLKPIREAAYKEGAMISPAERGTLERLGVLPAAPVQAQEDARDADRYRWVKQQAEFFPLVMDGTGLLCAEIEEAEEAIDAEIDAARAAKGGAA